MEPAVDAVAIASARTLAVGVAVYALLTGVTARQALRAGLEDRWSAIVATATMGALAWFLWVDGAPLLPSPLGPALLVVFAAALVFTFTYTLGRYADDIEAFQQRFGRRLHALLSDIVKEERLAAWERLRIRDPEARRKTPHLLLGLMVPIVMLGHFLFVALAGIPGTSVAKANLVALRDMAWLDAGLHLAAFALLLILFVLAPTELLRIRYPELSYPFKVMILSRLRSKEIGLFGAHYYIAMSLPVALFLALRVDGPEAYLFLAALAVTVFADAASALFGIRYGRRKWFHNPGKSYIGTAGGCAVAFVVTAPLVGVPLAAVAAAVFLIVDAIAPVPWGVSDNLLHPLALLATYLSIPAAADPMVPLF